MSPPTLVHEQYLKQLQEAFEQLRAIKKLIESNGCNCECDCDFDGHNNDCEICLACKINDIITESS
jgi:hypothetical protein